MSEAIRTEALAKRYRGLEVGGLHTARPGRKTNDMTSPTI